MKTTDLKKRYTIKSKISGRWVEVRNESCPDEARNIYYDCCRSHKTRLYYFLDSCPGPAILIKQN